MLQTKIQEEQPAEMFVSALGGSMSDVGSMSSRTNDIMVNFGLDTAAEVNILLGVFIVD